MTAYLLTPAQHSQLVDALEGTNSFVKLDEALEMLKAMTTNKHEVYIISPKVLAELKDCIAYADTLSCYKILSEIESITDKDTVEFTAIIRNEALEDAAKLSEDLVTALSGLPDVDRLIKLGDDIAEQIRKMKG